MDNRDDIIEGLDLGEQACMINIETFEGSQLFIICSHDQTTIREIRDKCLDNYEHSAFKNPDLYSLDLKKIISDQIYLDETMKVLGLPRKTTFKFVRNTDSLPKSDSSDTEKNKRRIKELKDSGTYNITAKTLSDRNILLSVAPEFSIADIKLLLDDQGIGPINCMRLIYAGNQLRNECTCADYNIRPDSSIHVVIVLRGGMYHETSGRAGDYQRLKRKIIVIGDFAINMIGT